MFNFSRSVSVCDGRRDTATDENWPSHASLFGFVCGLFFRVSGETGEGEWAWRGLGTTDLFERAAGKHVEL